MKPVDLLFCSQTVAIISVTFLSAAMLAQREALRSDVFIIAAITVILTATQGLLYILKHWPAQSSRAFDNLWFLTVFLAAWYATHGLLGARAEHSRQWWLIMSYGPACAILYDRYSGGKRAVLAASALTLGCGGLLLPENLRGNLEGLLICALLIAVSLVTVSISIAYLHQPGPRMRAVREYALPWSPVGSLISPVFLLIYGEHLRPYRDDRRQRDDRLHLR